MAEVTRFVFPTCFTLWLIAYAGLQFAALNEYDDFYSNEYSYLNYLIRIAVMVALCMTFGVCAYKYWPPYFPFATFAITSFLMIVGFLYPPISSFDFFLLTHGNERNPFGKCHRDCALVYEPSSYSLGINDSLDVFVIYSPQDNFHECIAEPINKKCKQLVEGLGIDKKYGITQQCELTVRSLSRRNYYRLTTHNCS